MTNLKYIVPIFLIIAFTGCVSRPTVAPSSNGLYGDKPVAQKIKGSGGQKIFSRTFPYTADEVLDASEKALMRFGMSIDEKSSDKGKLSASGMLVPETVDRWPFTLAVYVQQTSTKPTTQLTLVIDVQSFYMGFDPVGLSGSKVMTEITKVLSTY